MQKAVSNYFSHFSDNSLSAIYILMSMVGFVFNDTFTKLSSEEAGVFQVIFVRGIMLSAGLAVAVWRQKQPLNIFTFSNRALWVRAAAEIGLSFAFITALFNMPFANVVSIMQAAPLVLTLALAMTGKERVGWRRYLAIGIGFVGVLIIVRPGTAGFNTYSLLALAAVLLLVTREMITQEIPDNIPSLFIVYLMTTISTIVYGILTFVNGWDVIGTQTVGYLFGATIFVFIGFFFSVLAMRVGEASFSAPFRYSVLVMAIIIGIIVFNDYPDRYTLLGAVIIAAAGIYSLYRERVNRSK
ncbi:MAG: DMT family transporter [Chloroflexota bacterium]